MARAAGLRALQLLLQSPAVPVTRAGVPSQFSVASSRGGPTRYLVDLGQDPPSCTCPRWRYLAHVDEEVPAVPCKHIEAARLAIRARMGLGVPLPIG
ncbi:MAG TPA: SWIM zinc finger family protein [Thermoplasmata archaeon]|nr:SWIM zinc finger family protein [Thermoplasmata archaeon]